MRFSALTSQTRREMPAEAASQGLGRLVQAGYIQPLGSGLYGWLPAGALALQRLESTLLAELGRPGTQPLRLPALQAAMPLAGVGGGHGTPLVTSSLAMFLEHARTQVRSHRQLPARLWQRSQVWRAEGARSSLLPSRTGEVLELFALAPSAEACGSIFTAAQQRLLEAGARWGLKALPMEALAGAPGDKAADLVLELPGGEWNGLYCPACGYRAGQEAARFRRDESSEPLLPLEKVATPDCPTIETLATFLGVPTSRTAKAVFLTATGGTTGGGTLERPLMVLVRGDRAVNDARLRQILGAHGLRASTESEVRSLGAEPGYASPIGLPPEAVWADVEIPKQPNLVSGANQRGYHFLNVNCGRDYQPGHVVDIALAVAGSPCAACGGRLEALAGTRLASLEQGRADGCTYMDEAGQARPLHWAAMQVNLDVLLAALAEVLQDEHGLRLPPKAAPWPVHLVLLAGRQGEGVAEAEELNERLQAAGLEPLYDDRAESAGVKFNDADLMGMPIRVTVSGRSLAKGGVEVKDRASSDVAVVPLEQVTGEVRARLQND